MVTNQVAHVYINVIYYQGHSGSKRKVELATNQNCKGINGVLAAQCDNLYSYGARTNLLDEPAIQNSNEYQY